MFVIESAEKNRIDGNNWYPSYAIKLAQGTLNKATVLFEGPTTYCNLIGYSLTLLI